MSIEVRNINKTFGSFTALKDINLLVPSGELVALSPARASPTARSASSFSTMPFSVTCRSLTMSPSV